MPAVSGKTMLSFLEKRGFYVHRTSSSHYVLKSLDRPELRVVVAVHATKSILIGTLRAILRQADVTVDEFVEEF